jgi:hypothetical protein
MSELTRYQIEKITDEIGKQVEVLMDKISDSPEEHEAKIKKENKNVRIKKAKKTWIKSSQKSRRANSNKIE